ncbi:unnamed protein product [Amaranthus hypochondriacus]
MFLYSYTDNDLQEDRSRKVWVLPSYQEHDLQNHASGGIQHYEGFQVYRMMERQYYKAGEKRMEIDECMLIRIITRRGMVHLAWLAVVEKETSGFLHLIFYQL